MKTKTLLSSILLSVVLTSNAYANRIDCTVQSSLATTIMQVRQNGMSVTKAIALVSSEKNEDVRTLAKALVNLAYLKPRYAGDEYRTMAATDFGTEMYNLCNQINGYK